MSLRAVITATLLCCLATVARADCVVLLHGLARGASSMDKMAQALSVAGLRPVNHGYPSRKLPIADLADIAVERGLDDCGGSAHFVTHSLGGILVRAYAADNPEASIKRVVMLAPPNKGSEIVDRIGNVPGFRLVNGPAGMELGTQGTASRLGPVSFELGVIAGNVTFNPILSQFLPNPDDGKVSVERTKVVGMSDFLVVRRTHPFIMRGDDVIAQTIHFLKFGQFRQPPDP